jgi:hypothetical protein
VLASTTRTMPLAKAGTYGGQGKAVAVSPVGGFAVLIVTAHYFFPNSFRSFATLEAILLASSFVSIFAADRRPGSSS